MAGRQCSKASCRGAALDPAAFFTALAQASALDPWTMATGVQEVREALEAAGMRPEAG